MKMNFSLALICLLTILSCSNKRYLLNNDKDNRRFLIEIIKAGQKESLVKYKPLFIIDGIEYAYKDLSVKPILIKKSDIDKIEILNPDKSIKIFQEQGKDGVILITTKDGKKKEKYVLFYLDNKKLNKNEIDSINPMDIAKIDVIKDSTILRQYTSDLYVDGIVFITSNNSLVEGYRKIFSAYSDEYKRLIDTIPINEDRKEIEYFFNDNIISDSNFNTIDSISKLTNIGLTIESKSITNNKNRIYIKNK